VLGASRAIRTVKLTSNLIALSAFRPPIRAGRGPARRHGLGGCRMHENADPKQECSHRSGLRTNLHGYPLTRGLYHPSAFLVDNRVKIM